MKTRHLHRELGPLVDAALRYRWFYYSFILTGVLVTLWIYFSFFHRTPPDNVIAYFFVLLPSIAGFTLSARWLESGLKALVLPLLCKELGGWKYRPAGPRDRANFLRKAGVFGTGVFGTSTLGSVSDWVLGEVHGVQFELWNQSIKHGRNSKKEFFVIELNPIPELMEVIVRPPDMGFLGLHPERVDAGPIDVMNGNKMILLDRLKKVEDPDLLRKLKVFAHATNRLFTDHAKFYSLYFGRHGTFIVVEDPTPPFRIGGLFSTKEDILRRIDDVYGELLVPGRIVETWLPKLQKYGLIA